MMGVMGIDMMGMMGMKCMMGIMVDGYTIVADDGVGVVCLFDIGRQW